MKHYVAETYRKRLSGVFSECLRLAVAGMTPGGEVASSAKDLLSYYATTAGMSDDNVTTLALDDALNGLCESFWKTEVARYWQQTVDALQACQRTNHLQRTTFQWFHENLLPVDAITSPPIRYIYPPLSACKRIKALNFNVVSKPNQ